ncbi:AAA family ATPase [Bradymonas sediminis]|uniref:AAA family ATPase n=1 Tax=Bradymonas sediminis TaxID=1548548 RepID=A0A2Z4FJS5_9DELT|nr:MoxR family ATPase [Bradymonas sediminis]AWV88976.1 AAA family ATPase [Bradymonas sediminis]TDP71987.1 MoxR-like ATPase [Bradymonas sediminis]
MTTDAQAPTSAKIEEKVAQFQRDCLRMREEMGKMMVGQRPIIDGVLITMLSGGNVLLEGVPGLGKTMLVRTLSETLGLAFSRIQFTPDLMPTDILGTTMIVDDEQGGKHFKFERGPIFANIVLADEINRATPKTQAAMLEAMQERSVTIGKETMKLDDPFFVLATQNPLEMEGTYPLPEAQLDRFLYKLNVPFPSLDELHTIMERTTQSERPEVSEVIDQKRLLEMKEFARQVPLARHVQDYALRLLQATHPDNPSAPDITKRYVRFGSSPRGAQGILLSSKVRALFDGRFNVSTDDIRASALPAFRHRVILNFEGEAEGITSDQILAEILKSVPENSK